jgi:hypothetical protein
MSRGSAFGSCWMPNEVVPDAFDHLVDLLLIVFFAVAVHGFVSVVDPYLYATPFCPTVSAVLVKLVVQSRQGLPSWLTNRELLYCNVVLLAELP